MQKKTKEIYLDSNASEPMRPEARDALVQSLTIMGNPASIHAAGRAARRVLEDARTTVGRAVGAAPSEIVFCSGGTEANAAAIAALSPGRAILIGATEHDAVRAAAPGATMLPVHRDGTLNLTALDSALRAAGPALVCLMLANNETGVLHPIADAAALCRAHDALLHVDAVQAAGRIPVDMAVFGADTLALSAHKLGGPKGAGALVLAPGLHLPALIAGGGQERGRRGGTPAVPAIAGFAAAIAAAGDAARLAPLRDRLERAACGTGAIVCGTGPRLPNTSCLALPGMPAHTQVITLDLAGIAVSAGAACSSGKITESRVLIAMGLAAFAACAIRVSLPWNATDADVDGFIDAYAKMKTDWVGRAAPPKPPASTAPGSAGAADCGTKAAISDAAPGGLAAAARPIQSFL
jgi:cysteine desulfurase